MIVQLAIGKDSTLSLTHTYTHTQTPPQPPQHTHTHTHTHTHIHTHTPLSLSWHSKVMRSTMYLRNDTLQVVCITPNILLVSHKSRWWEINKINMDHRAVTPVLYASKYYLYINQHLYHWHSTEKSVTTMLTYRWKCTVLHCNHLGNTWEPLVTRHFDYCASASEGDNQSVRSSAPVVSRCFPGGNNVKLYISRGRLAWWLRTFLHCVSIYVW